MPEQGQRLKEIRELVLEHPAIDLKGLEVERSAPRRAPLHAPRHVPVVRRREEVPEAGLPEVLLVEVVAQPADVGEVVRADLERRLADLERAVRRRPFRRSSTTTDVSGRILLSWSARVRPASPPPKIATS